MNSQNLILRLITRLLSEASYLEADKIEFSKSKKIWNVNISKKGLVLKKETLDHKWIKILFEWLKNRTVDISFPPLFDTEDRSLALVSIAENILYFTYSNLKADKFCIEQIINVSRSHAFDRIGILRPARTVLTSLIDRPGGIVVASDSEDSLQESARFIAGCSNACEIVDLDKFKESENLGDGKTFIISTKGTDPVEVFLLAQESLPKKHFEILNGVFCQSFVTSVCEQDDESISTCELCRGMGCQNKIGIQKCFRYR